MKKVQNRYTINFIIGDQKVPFAKTTVRNLDLLTTNFSNIVELIEYFEQYAKLNHHIKKIIVNYEIPITSINGNEKEINHMTMELPLIFKDKRMIAEYQNDLLSKYSIKGNIIDKIKHFITESTDYILISTSDIKNVHLRNRLCGINEKKYNRNINASRNEDKENEKDLTFYLNKLLDDLGKQYKSTRDLALAFHNQLDKHHIQFIQPIPYVKNNREVRFCMNNMVYLNGFEKSVEESYEQMTLDDIPATPNEKDVSIPSKETSQSTYSKFSVPDFMNLYYSGKIDEIIERFGNNEAGLNTLKQIGITIEELEKRSRSR